jgi:AcrR family transcriptional regulator
MSRSSAPEITDAVAPSVKPPAAYHHGDLRSALIAAARFPAPRAPPESITLKSLAVRLGVSQPAPYRHFGSREALLAAVTADGFERFSAALAASQIDCPPDKQFEASSLAYLAFGRSNPGVYRLMFASRVLNTSQDEALGQVSSAAFNNLVEGVGAHVPPHRALPMAIWVWSTLHGLVMLEAEGLSGGSMNGQITPADVIHEMVSTLQGRGDASPS